MLTIDALQEYGADTTTGLKRCAGKEALYLKLVQKIPQSDSFELLNQAIAEQDLEKAFEAAHALKGICANLALTPLSEPASEMTELLRAHTDMDYQDFLTKINKALDELKALF
ncbi:MAG: Hpt domain-containing protein [Eubacterium sp.]|nr:Hpt domain-containing protein [Eubacterium sp.]